MTTESVAEATLVEKESAPSEANETAGAVLCSERERSGLTEKDVADQLHITVHYVKAIESDRYEKLPGAIFAKGYMKSYALLLDVEEERIISLYEEYVRRHPLPEQERQRNRNGSAPLDGATYVRQPVLQSRNAGLKKLVPWAIGFIGALLIALAAVWVYTRFLG